MASLQEARRDRNEAIEKLAEEDESAWTYQQQRRYYQNRHKGEQDQTGGNILDSAMEKAGEMKDKVKESARETKDKAGDMKDRVMHEARETKDKTRDVMERSASDKEKGGNSNREKLEEYKESAAEAGRRAREYLKEVKEEARVRLAAETKERLGETEESARKNLEDVKQRAAEKAEEAQHKRLVEPSEKEKGTSATENIYGSFPNMTEKFKEKLTMPNEIVEHKRGDLKSHEVGGDKSKSRERLERETEEEEDPMLRVKDADQMTGTWFNDVGKMGGEGTGFISKK